MTSDEIKKRKKTDHYTYDIYGIKKLIAKTEQYTLYKTSEDTYIVDDLGQRQVKWLDYHQAVLWIAKNIPSLDKESPLEEIQAAIKYGIEEAARIYNTKDAAFVYLFGNMALGKHEDGRYFLIEDPYCSYWSQDWTDYAVQEKNDAMWWASLSSDEPCLLLSEEEACNLLKKEIHKIIRLLTKFFKDKQG